MRYINIGYVLRWWKSVLGEWRSATKAANCEDFQWRCTREAARHRGLLGARYSEWRRRRHTII